MHLPLMLLLSLVFLINGIFAIKTDPIRVKFSLQSLKLFQSVLMHLHLMFLCFYFSIGFGVIKAGPVSFKISLFDASLPDVSSGFGFPKQWDLCDKN
jgi:hypothetical protein